MRLDARELAAGTTIDTDLCIIGAGPAGLILASELLGHVRDILLLESGGDAPEPSAEALNAGTCDGDAYAGLSETRSRAVGGTATTWNTPVLGRVGAKYAPLDPVDLEEREAEPLSGWPFGWEELVPWYDAAWRACGIDATMADAAAGLSSPHAPFRLDGPHLTSGLYRLAPRDALVRTKIAAVERARNARLCTHATVVRLEASGRRVTSARVAATGAGHAITIRARTFVLAAGAVENARLLLLSGLGNDSDWVGRCFMEHPRDRSITLLPASRDFHARAAFYDEHKDGNGTTVVGRLALRPPAIRAGELPSAGGTLLPVPRRAVRTARGLLGPLARAAPLDLLLPSGGHGWARHPFPPAVLAGMSVLLNLEQSPHPENRVTLGHRRDPLGLPVAALHWRWRDGDARRLARLREVVVAELEGAGLGRAEVVGDARPDPNAHHHAGTTRMHRDPRRGVVDADSRLHEMDNLFVAGSSVFPTAGFVNPVLTIIALAIRLADRLRGVQ